jgi:hypothetical protein
LLRAAHRANQFVEFELDGVAIAILGILNQKYHQECDDRRTCVDGQLPRIAELEYRACDPPDHDDQSRSHECRRMAVARAVHLAKRERGDEE